MKLSTLLYAGCAALALNLPNVAEAASFTPINTTVVGTGTLYFTDGYYFHITCNYQFNGMNLPGGVIEFTSATRTGGPECATAQNNLVATFPWYITAQSSTQANIYVRFASNQPLLRSAETFGGSWNNATSQLSITNTQPSNRAGLAGTITISPAMVAQ